MAMASEVEGAWTPPLRHPTHVEDGPYHIGQSHAGLICKSNVAPGLPPVDDQGMDGRHNPGEAHGGEDQGSERPEFAGGEGGGKEDDEAGDAHDGDAGEVGELPVGIALEDVVDGWEERGDDHDGDAGVVDAEEEAVELVGVAGEEMANAAG